MAVTFSSSLPPSFSPRIAVFSITVLRDERVVVVAEQRPACTDEEAFTWMNNVVPAVESIHGLNLYSIVLVPPGRLPRVRARGRGLWVWLSTDSHLYASEYVLMLPPRFLSGI